MRSFVWFLISLFNPLLLLLYWNGTNQITPSLISYYLFLIIASGCLESHIEDEVSDLDIKQGGLVKFILKPFSYFWIRFFDETPYRVAQGFYGLLAFFIIVLFLHPQLTIVHTPLKIILTLLIWILAYLTSFILKMILGLITFWTAEIRGVFQISDLLFIIFGGYMMPLVFMPHTLQIISKFLPFPYIIYYPVAALSDQLNIASLIQVVTIQLGWILLFYLIHSFIWKKGVKQFTGVGQ